MDTLRVMHIGSRAAALALLAACSNDPPRAAPPPAPRPDARPAATPTPPAGVTEDPEHGQFTVEQATVGLPGTGKLSARIVTDKGEIVCELFPDRAPATVASFVGLARGVRAFLDLETGYWVKRPFFDGLAFYRVIPDFMIQGGDPRSRDYGHRFLGTGGPGYTLPDEIAPGLRFDRPGRLAMANAGPGTAGSQFFVTETAVADLDGKYTIFGQCTGIPAIKAIARVQRDGKDKPNEPMRMRVEILRK
jgi:peptidyl-prolyl cis-trans isomerase A (cyclophilin A)